jgi:type III pantothenate kinase
LVGRSTVESIQSGLYFGTRAVVKGLTHEIRQQAFRGEPAVVIGTGGLSRLFEQEEVFDVQLPDLVLLGLERALALNDGASQRWNAPVTEVPR